MKKFKLFKIFSIFAIAAAGAVAVGVGTRAPKVEAAEASAITNYAIEIRYSSGFGSTDPEIYTWENGVNAVTYDMHYLWDNEYGQKIFAYTPSSSEPLYQNLIIKTKGSWNSKTKDLTSPTTPGIYNYYGTFDDTGCSNIEKMKIYLYDYDLAFKNESTVYAHFERSTASALKFDDGTGIPMTKMNDASKGYVYSVDVSNAIDRVTFRNASGSITTGKLSGTNANYVYFYGGGVNAWWDNIKYVLAHSWAQNLMNFRNVSKEQGAGRDGTECEGLYSNAKSVYQHFVNNDQSVLTEINNGFPNALERLSDWAKHNHESFTISNGVGSFYSNPNIFKTVFGTDGNDGLIISIIIVSLVSVSAVAGFYFIRRRKHI